MKKIRIVSIITLLALLLASTAFALPDADTAHYPRGGKLTLSSTNGTDVNIRSTSSTSGTIIAKPQNGATFTVVDVTTQWVKIQVNTTTTGWVRWDYLKKAGNGTVGQIKVGSFTGYTNGALPLYNSTSTTSTVVGYTQHGAALPVIRISNPGWLSTSSARYIQGILVRANSSDNPGIKTVTTTQQISLYESYNSSGPSLTVNTGVTVLILDTTVSGWILVATPSGTGWIKSYTLPY